MATSKAGGSSGNGRESHSKRLGCKKFGSEAVHIGDIIIRQRGTPVNAGNGVGRGSDDTLFATAHGYVKFSTGFKGRSYVSVVPEL